MPNSAIGLAWDQYEDRRISSAEIGAQHSCPAAANRERVAAAETFFREPPGKTVPASARERWRTLVGSRSTTSDRRRAGPAGWALGRLVRDEPWGRRGGPVRRCHD